MWLDFFALNASDARLNRLLDCVPRAFVVRPRLKSFSLRNLANQRCYKRVILPWFRFSVAQVLDPFA